jgi:hypothetical protein
MSRGAGEGKSENLSDLCVVFQERGCIWESSQEMFVGDANVTPSGGKYLNSQDWESFSRIQDGE